MTSKERFDSFWADVILSDFPDAKIVYKTDSKLMKFLHYSLFWIFNPTFMTNYITVIGTTVYLPSKKQHEETYESLISVLAHEYIHMCDFRDGKSSVLYPAPQLFALMSLGSIAAIWNLWALLGLAFLLFLIPGIPSPWRTDIEGNGYVMTMFYKRWFVEHYNTEYVPARHAAALSEQFTGSMYYYMCRNKEKVIKMLLERYETLPKTHKGFKKVEEWLKIHLS